MDSVEHIVLTVLGVLLAAYIASAFIGQVLEIDIKTVFGAMLTGGLFFGIVGFLKSRLN